MKLFKFINPFSNVKISAQDSINLHIGCNETRLKGYFNIDVR